MSTTKKQTEWKLAELAAEAGVSPRTVRYYVQRGLLSAPAFKGPDTVYGEEHLLRLKAIRVLQARFLPLDAIQVELARLSPDAPLPRFSGDNDRRGRESSPAGGFSAGVLEANSSLGRLRWRDG